jgi:hypothetical protein
LLEKPYYGCASMYGTTMLERENDLLFYAAGSVTGHGNDYLHLTNGKRYAALTPGTLRKDGFVSLASDKGHGKLPRLT